MSKTLDGKVAVVTGASRGIGREIAESLGRKGALVAVHYGRSKGPADEVVAAIKNTGGDAFAVQADLAAPDTAEKLWAAVDQEVKERTGSTAVDILVNNAGIAPFVGFADTKLETLDEIYAVNVRAPFFITQKAASRLRNGGRVVNFSTVVARAPMPAVAAYSALKAPIDTLTRALAVEFGERDITVNAIAPGAIATDMAEFLNDHEGREYAMSKQALKHIATATEVADVVTFLASQDARWVTGQTIEVSGGSAISY
ncbi:MAG: SDR family oxidoreductase [Pseudomonadota bacterium]